MKKYKELIVKQTGKESSRSHIFSEFKIYSSSKRMIADDIDVIRTTGKIYIDYIEMGKIRFSGITSYHIDCGILAIRGEDTMMSERDSNACDIKEPKKTKKGIH